MKTIVNKLIFLASFILIATACNDSMGKLDHRLSEVKTLIEPVEGKSIELSPSASAELYFEWERTNAAESGAVVYQIAFDKKDGDFSDPVYVTSSDNNGFQNHATISHKLMNKIAGKIGINPSESGTFKWTAFSLKGTNALKAAQEHSITVTRLAGFDEIPDDVYLTGEGSEAGDDLSKALIMKGVSSGKFEIYTQLTAGKPYFFTNANSGTPLQYYTDSKGVLKLDGTSTVTKTGVYKIELDFTISSAVYTEITGVGLFFSPENKVLFPLNYIGKGVWKASSQPVTFKQEGWGRDERYKFVTTRINSNGEEFIQMIGTLNDTDSRPSAASPESYYYVKETPTNQWDQKWKFAGEMDLALVDVTLYMQADKPYTHEIKKVGSQ
ncbi:MAG TPA: hypothetical protein DDW85_07120 [Porphyromonadaceae bacterium]|jgi:hypothetical protein|nr:hypothetical protein [Porphyromonadaceae bacterium]